MTKINRIKCVYLLIWLSFCLGGILIHSAALADVKTDLVLLRNRCLYYAVGHAPNDINTNTIRYGLYAQSPFSAPDTEIDIAASGFALAALPSAVEVGLITKNDAEIIAINAAQAIRNMVLKSASATSPAEIELYGYAGMLHHYCLWTADQNEFRGKSGVEVSSIDTALLMYGLMVCANYFQGDVLQDFEVARAAIRWKDWLDTSTSGHLNQFRMSYNNGGFNGWWDWRSEETMLIILFAAMSDQSLDVRILWDAWERCQVTYRSPEPDPLSFTCYATWNGDPFTVFYGLHFFRFKRDFRGIDWFDQSRIAYRGHVEFFKKERGYLDYMTFAFSNGSNGAIAEPKCSPETPITRIDCPIYSLAGGLEYYDKDPEKNEIAAVLSELVQKGGQFFRWTGWPPEAVNATTSAHEVSNDDIIGQNIVSIAISIDNYLTGRIRKFVLKDSAMRKTVQAVMPLITTPTLVPLLLDENE